MNMLTDIITYIRRIIKTPSNAEITDNLLIDYINRFWLMDVDARLQLFDLKTKYTFVTQPGVDKYNMPLYQAYYQPGNQLIGTFPIYQGFFGPAYVKGVSVPFYTQRDLFFNTWPNYTQTLIASTIGDGTAGPYQLKLPFQNVPGLNNSQFALRGHIDIYGLIAAGSTQDPPLNTDLLVDTSGGQFNGYSKVPTANIDPGIYITTIDATGANVVVTDSGMFLPTDVNKGLLTYKANAGPYGNLPLPNGYSAIKNIVDYASGDVFVEFPVPIPAGVYINANCYYFQTGLPRGILFYDNVLTLRNPPDQQYLIELNAYLSPAAFLNTSDAVPFAYMAEYIARGAARKILSDTGDQEQLMFYEPFFREQEMLVWKRSQRQFTATRTQTLYSTGLTYGNTGASMGQGGT